MKKCKACKVAPGAPCLAVEDPERYRHFCAWAATDNPELHKVIVGRSKLGVDPPAPTLPQMVVNFTTAAVRHVAEGRPKATEQQKADRLAICRSNVCGLYADGDRCMHTSCGCFLQLKADWADSQCPLDPPLWT